MTDPPPLTHQLTHNPSAQATPSPPSPCPSPFIWNERFQAALELPEADSSAALANYSVLSSLSSDFLSLARMYGRAFISELRLPAGEKMVGEEGGMRDYAGAVKFVVRGLLFKLWNDVQLCNGRWLYGEPHATSRAPTRIGLHPLHHPVPSSLSPPIHSLLLPCPLPQSALPGPRRRTRPPPTPPPCTVLTPLVCAARIRWATTSCVPPSACSPTTPKASACL